MSKVAKRLLVFVLGVPIILALVFVDFKNHLLLNLAVCVFSILASNELYNIIYNKNPESVQKKSITMILSAIVPISATALAFLRADWVDHSMYIFIGTVLAALAFEVPSAKDFKYSIARLCNSTFIILYCGFLITYIIKMGAWEDETIPHLATYFISLFFVMVFLCDSTAWLFGMLFGKSTRGFVKASPNKSLVGFFGGYVGSIVMGCGACFFFPEVFGSQYWKLVVLGALTATTSIFGDLVESVIKRSCETKDSGNLILGRGGVLDSIDSIVFSAPIFFIASHFLYDL